MPISHWTQYTFKRPWKCVYNSDISLNCDGFNGKLLCWWNIVSCTWNGRGWNFLQRDSLSIHVSHYNNISRCILIQLFLLKAVWNSCLLVQTGLITQWRDSHSFTLWIGIQHVFWCWQIGLYSSDHLISVLWINITVELYNNTNQVSLFVYFLFIFFFILITMCMLFKLMCRGGVGGGGTMSLDVCSLCNL